MDLNACPRCRGPWRSGATKCAACHFAPIGAELAGLKTKVKKKRRWRDPTASSPLYGIAVLGLVGVYGFMERPWEDDFATLRRLVGQEVGPAIRGSWRIQKIVTAGTPLFDGDTKSGTFTFSRGGGMTLQAEIDGTTFDVTGRYVLTGETLLMTGWNGTGAKELGGSMKCRIDGPEENDLVLALPNRTLVYLHRVEGREKVARSLAFRIIPPGGAQ